MKQRFGSFFLVVMMVLGCGIHGGMIAATAIIPGEDAVTAEEKVYCDATMEDEFADDRVLVVLNNAASTSLKTYGISDFSGVGIKSVTDLTSSFTALANAKLKCEPIPEQFKTNSNTVTFDGFYDIDLDTFNQVLCLKLKTPGKQNVLNAIKQLEKHPDVRYVGPDYVITAFSDSDIVPDPYCNEQWALDMIHMPEAWEIESDATVKVGVIDTGVYKTENNTYHPDLSAEYVIGFLSVVDEYIDCRGDALPTDIYGDQNGHGTLVTGIIGAIRNNGIGISGICSTVQITSLKVFDQNGEGYASSVIRAINYAEENNIPILNFSGGYYVTVGSSVYYDCSMIAAIQSYGGLLICAAGNKRIDIDENPVAPACYSLDNIITVGACDREDRIWSTQISSGVEGSGSNYGELTVDLFAPGDSILSCYPLALCDNESCANNPKHLAHGYHKESGTSFAAPYVTGVAAMILAKYPAATVERVIDRIRIGVDTVYDGTENVYADYCLWGGRLNAYKALHNHGYSLSSYNSVHHTLTCDCGVIKEAAHEWQTVELIMPGGQIMIGERCAVCGYENY